MRDVRSQGRSGDLGLAILLKDQRYFLPATLLQSEGMGFESPIRAKIDGQAEQACRVYTCGRHCDLHISQEIGEHIWLGDVGGQAGSVYAVQVQPLLLPLPHDTDDIITVGQAVYACVHSLVFGRCSYLNDVIGAANEPATCFRLTVQCMPLHVLHGMSGDGELRGKAGHVDKYRDK